MKKIIMLLALFTTMMAASAQPEGGMKKPHSEGKPPRTEVKKPEQEKKKAEKAEKKSTSRVYLYGVAMSMQDSVVYMTDELILDDAVLYNKNTFLEGRDQLSAQLSDHMAQKGEKNRVCSVTFAKNVKKLDKKYLKQVEKLKKRGYLVKSVGQGEFRFKSVTE